MHSMDRKRCNEGNKKPSIGHPRGGQASFAVRWAQRQHPLQPNHLAPATATGGPEASPALLMLTSSTWLTQEIKQVTACLRAARSKADFCSAYREAEAGEDWRAAQRGLIEIKPAPGANPTRGFVRTSRADKFCKGN